MKTHLELKKTKQKAARLEAKIKRLSKKERNEDTRHKVLLGWTVIKSGMEKYSQDVILGALINAVEQIEQDPETEKVFRLKGEMAFLRYRDKAT